MLVLLGQSTWCPCWKWTERQSDSAFRLEVSNHLDALLRSTIGRLDSVVLNFPSFAV